MSENLYVLSICLPLAAIVVVFAIRAFAATRQARARLAHDDAYRQMAQTAVTSQAATAAVLPDILAGIAEMRTRLGAIEGILRAVG